MKLWAMLCRATEDRWVMVESSDKQCSTGEENEKPLQHSCFENPMNSSVQSLCHVQLCNPMNCSMPGLPVHHQLTEFTQTHIHRVSDAIQPSHPLSSPSPPALNLSQHQDLFKWVSTLHQVAKVLEFQLQHQCFQWTPRADLLQNGLVGYPWSLRDSQEFSNTTVQNQQFFSTQLSSQSNSYTRTWPLEKP